MLRQDRFHHVLANAIGKAAANERLRHLAGPEAMDASLLLIALHNGAEALRDFVGRHFDLHLAGKLGIQRRTMLMSFVGMVVRVVMAFVIVGLMLVAFVGMFFGLRSSF